MNEIVPYGFDFRTIERCVIHLTSVSPTRLGYIDVNGKMKVPITLPRVKCLDDEEEDGEVKYQPYKPEPITKTVIEPVKLREGICAGLTIRQRKAFELHVDGVSTKDIAALFRTSSSSVRNMISTARLKLGMKKIPLNNPTVSKDKPEEDMNYEQ